MSGQRRQFCQWTEDSDGIWQTQCADAFTFIDAGPSENGMRFCCYCGGALREAKYYGDEDDENEERRP